MTTAVALTEIPGVCLRALTVHADERGSFVETYRAEWFPDRPMMLQSNRADSVGGVLRGLHFHRRQADYWYVTAGRILVALADLRPGSPTQGKTATYEIGDGLPFGVYIPPGVAHGYYAAEACTMTYLVDQTYDASDEFGVTWDDPELGIEWGTATPILSGRDQNNPRVSELDPALLVPYSE
tara:strand:+ start:4665 stop:5210 length:546 start_codon:yes stop_codon:yes gene_type:complete